MKIFVRSFVNLVPSENDDWSNDEVNDRVLLKTGYKVHTEEGREAGVEVINIFVFCFTHISAVRICGFFG